MAEVGDYLASFRHQAQLPLSPIGVGPGEPDHLSGHQSLNQCREVLLVRVAITHQHPYSTGVADDDRTNLDQLQAQGAGTHTLEGRVFQMHPQTLEQRVGEAG